MLALAGLPLGLSFRFLDPSPDAPAGEVGELLVGAYDDPALLDRLAAGAAALTYEFENVPVEAARRVGAVPAAAALEVAQDRLEEKPLFRRLGIPTAPFDDEVSSFPALLKTRRLGYDGKGQRLVETRPGPGPGHAQEACARRPRPVRPRALAPRRPRPRRRHALLPARRERARGRHPAPLARAGAGRAAGAGGEVRARVCWTSSATSACSRWSCSTSAASCSRTSSRPASTTPGTGRSRARRRASSRTICARSSGCPSGRPPFARRA